VIDSFNWKNYWKIHNNSRKLFTAFSMEMVITIYQKPSSDVITKIGQKALEDE